MDIGQRAITVLDKLVIDDKVCLVDLWTFSGALVSDGANDEANRCEVTTISCNAANAVNTDDFLVCTQLLVVNLHLGIAQGLFTRVVTIDVGTICFQEVKTYNAMPSHRNNHLLHAFIEDSHHALRFTIATFCAFSTSIWF